MTGYISLADTDGNIFLTDSDEEIQVLEDVVLAISASLRTEVPLKRGVATYVDNDNKVKTVTPALDLLDEVEEVNSETGMLMVCDTTQVKGQKEHSIRIENLFSMNPYSILGRDTGFGGQKVLKTERMLATQSRAGFQEASDRVQTLVQTLTDATTITWNIALGGTGIITLGGNRTINFSNAIPGKRYVLIIKQDATGGRTLTFASGFKFPGGTAPSLVTTTLAVNILEFMAETSSILHCIAQELDSK